MRAKRPGFEGGSRCHMADVRNFRANHECESGVDYLEREEAKLSSLREEANWNSETAGTKRESGDQPPS